MPNLVFNMQDTKATISFLAAQKNKGSFPYLEYQILYIITTIWAKGQDEFLSSVINPSSEMQNARDAIISKMNYSNIQCVIWLRPGILLQMKKR